MTIETPSIDETPDETSSLQTWIQRLHKEHGQVDWKNPPRFAVVVIDCVKADWATIPPEFEARGLRGVYETFIVDLHSATHCCELTPSYWLEPLEVVLDVDINASDKDKDYLDLQKFESYPLSDGHYTWCMHLESNRHGTIIDTWEPELKPGDDEPTIEDAREVWVSNSPL